jgi:predicted TIM-barrel fold metal-dependent hydrolase
VRSARSKAQFGLIGEYPDADGAKPFWKLVTDLDIPVFLHPGWCGDSPAMQEYRLNSSVGRPADNCLSLARIIVRGILEQFPTLYAAPAAKMALETVGPTTSCSARTRRR